MSTVKQPRRRIQTGQLVATTNQSLFNCIRTGQIQLKYLYSPLSYKVRERLFTTSY